MNTFQFIKLQTIYLIKNTIGSKRFFDLSWPTSKKRRIIDKNQKLSLSLHIRDSDDWVQIEHIFLNEEFNLIKTSRQLQIKKMHDEIKSIGVKPLIIDLGANIGLATKYFDIIYPGSRIFAVEPDKGNCAIAVKNLPSHVILHCAAIASKQGAGQLVATGRNVGFRVEKNSQGEVPFITVQSLIDKAAGCVPFLIKIDIEGFESDLFCENTEWIDLFPVILIELHDWMLPGKTVTQNFLREMASRRREFMHFDGYIASIACDLTKFKIL